METGNAESAIQLVMCTYTYLHQFVCVANEVSMSVGSVSNSRIGEARDTE